mgnify:CR=1 FL=1|tara:strand:- start:1606 stop:2049 length:444 start_codon:yes stop_codon:yes gene_type:complete
MRALADSSFPQETGGLLMGYFDDQSKDVVVTDIIGPGPKGSHKRMSFVPDYEFQEKEIARIYEETNRTSTYLGDWHTHPKGHASLSGQDLNTLCNIAFYPKARVPSPIMVLLAGNKAQWQVRFWQLQTTRRFFWKKTTLVNLNSHTF